jgi:hypothetical protein
MLTIALVVAAASLEIEIAGGVAKPLDPEFGEGPDAVGLQARVGVHVKPHTLGAVLKVALAAANAPAMRWYEATRHSFASRYVQAGGSLMKLAAILGHSATEVTLRYAHLQRATSRTMNAPWWTFSSNRPRWFPWRNGALDQCGSLTLKSTGCRRVT